MDALEVNFEYEEKRWVPLIGKFILDFANIEEFLNEVIRHHLRNTLLNEADMPDNLGKRIKLFEKILKKDVLDNPKDKAKLTQVVKDIQDLVPIRNLVAHNSLGLIVEENAKGQMRIGGFQITGRKNKAIFLDYKSLAAKVKQLETYRNTLLELVLIFHKVLADEIARKNMAAALRKK